MVTHAAARTAWFAIAVAAFPCLFRANAPYGKFVRAGWGPYVDGNVGWATQEIVSPVFFWLGYTRGDAIFDDLTARARDDGYVRALAWVWVAHYVHRALIYPATRRMSRTTAATVCAAVGFNVINGALIGAELAYGAVTKPSNARVVVGAAIMACGAALNVWHDALLARARRASRAYVVPTGGLFHLVACPHYLGETIEWCGFAVLTAPARSTAVFAFWTFANLFPRAVATRAYYRRRFGARAYPDHIRAMIPHVA
jgi:3-oxo-5-alpha-steroid 4-dehydrogenase 1